jgi:hypothetical protein
LNKKFYEQVKNILNVNIPIISLINCFKILVKLKKKKILK